MGRKGKASPKAQPAKTAGLKKPVAGILLGGFAALAMLGLSSYRPHGAAGNWAGPVGHGLAGILLEAAGVGGYAL